MAEYTNNRNKNYATSHLDKMPGATHVSARPIILHLNGFVKKKFYSFFVYFYSFCANYTKKPPTSGGFSSIFRLALLNKGQFIGIFTNFEGNLPFFVGNFDHFASIFARFGQKLG